jgi:1-acyl-sn-glycerol-3-phosphate acyltransferase
VRVTVIGREHLPSGSSFLLMPNHQSHFDIPVLLGCLQTQFRWLAKAELFKIPIFGKAMRGCGYISIDRSNREAAFASIRQAGNAIRGKVSVLIFPEGTRSPDGRLLPFKKGGFVLAADSGVPILPIGIYGTGRILPKKRLLLDPGPVVLRIGPPVDTAGYDRETKDALMEKVHQALCEAVADASAGRMAC